MPQRVAHIPRDGRFTTLWRSTSAFSLISFWCQWEEQDIIYCHVVLRYRRYCIESYCTLTKCLLCKADINATAYWNQWINNSWIRVWTKMRCCNSYCCYSFNCGNSCYQRLTWYFRISSSSLTDLWTVSTCTAVINSYGKKARINRECWCADVRCTSASQTDRGKSGEPVGGMILNLFYCVRD